MIKIIIAVMDIGTESFATPFFVHHTVEATRQFISECQNPDSQICKHAKDYELWKLGTFNDQTGVIENEPERLLRAIDHVRS